MPGDGLHRLRSRLGAYKQHRLYDVRETTKAARAAADSRFVRLVDPELVLPEPERARRVAAARREHFTRLAILSAEARANRSKRNDVQRRTSTAAHVPAAPSPPEVGDDIAASPI